MKDILFRAAVWLFGFLLGFVIGLDHGTTATPRREDCIPKDVETK